MKTVLSIIFVALLVLVTIAGCPREKPSGATGNPPPTDVGKADTGNEGGLSTPGQETPPATDGTTPPGTESTAADQTTPPTGEGQPPVSTTPQMGTSNQITPPGEEKPDFTVVLETTKGNIEIGLYRTWSPQGVDHFVELVNAGFYNGAPWFRVMEGFVAQAGIAADPKLNEQYQDKTIPDETLVKGNLPGYVAYGKTQMPNSRSTHFFINLVDNSGGLDPQGFACFGKVLVGMDVVQKLHRCVFENQGELSAAGGLAKFKAMFPEADYITKAYIKK